MGNNNSNYSEEKRLAEELVIKVRDELTKLTVLIQLEFDTNTPIALAVTGMIVSRIQNQILSSKKSKKSIKRLIEEARTNLASQEGTK